MTLREVRNGRRTMLFENELHVATIIEHQKPQKGAEGLYVWYVAHDGGRASSYVDAHDQIEEQLRR